MLGILINFKSIFTVICTHSATGHSKDSRVESVLQLFKQTLKNPEHSSNQQRNLEDINDSSNTDNEIFTDFGSLKSDEIINLIQQASNDYTKNTKHHGYSDTKTYNHHAHSELYSGNKYNEKAVKELLSNIYGIKSEAQKFNKKRLTPNRLLVRSSEIENEVKHEAVGNLNDYSKIYIILNPQAIQKSRDKNTINELLSKILSISTSSSRTDRKERGSKGRYKGFPVQKDISLRRARRDSREMFAAKDSDDDYKQKRNRNEHGSGGGGRTAIPYIRHRGDIYERDD
ncbi:hypothetical protein K1T71_001977 [Dendrolimus kikuchii]|uniref:Uncharacterized protein n=1 Tax=Dendrolimus kikuchii TaxID=765133 RepID=A0ACC1DFZ6_9NEOP|nr:hypothetical protein K1T71_001977 [Dendrolimus kikuchii]